MARWHKLPVATPTHPADVALPAGWMEMANGAVHFKYGTGLYPSHSEIEGSFQAGWDPSAFYFSVGLHAPYIVVDKEFNANQGIELLIRRTFRTNIDDPHGFFGSWIGLMLREPTNATFGMFGAGTPTGCYFFELFIEDAYDPTDQGFWPFGWASVFFGWNLDTLTPVYSPVEIAWDGMGVVSQDFNPNGNFELPPIGGTYKLRFEVIDYVLSCYYNDALLIQVDLVAYNQQLLSYVAPVGETLGDQQVPLLTSGQPGFYVNDIDGTVEIQVVRVYSIGTVPGQQLDCLTYECAPDGSLQPYVCVDPVGSVQIGVQIAGVQANCAVGTPFLIDSYNIDLDARVNVGPSYSAGIAIRKTVMVPTGVYQVTLRSGALYVAWSRWASDGDPTAAGLPWSNDFVIRHVVANTDQDVITSARQTTPALAFAAFVPTNVSGDATYDFWFRDTPITDNRQGLSIKLTRIG